MLRRLAAFATLFSITATVAPAQTAYVVDSASDTPAATSAIPDGQLTLREAITAANTNAPFGDAPAGSSAAPDAIAFADGITTVTTRQGEMRIEEAVRIDGGGDVTVQPRSNVPTRIFWIEVDDGGLVEMVDLTLRGGYVFSSRSPTTSDGQGGAIYLRDGDLVARGVTFVGNRASEGGAVFVFGIPMDPDNSLTVTGCTFLQNRALSGLIGEGGGALFLSPLTTVTSSDNTFTRNFAVQGRANGGAVFNGSGAFTDTGSRFEGNQAAIRGGAMELLGSTAFADLTDTVFQGNRVGPDPAGGANGDGGAIHISLNARLLMTGGAMLGNAAMDDGGAIWNSSSGFVSLDGTTLTGNVARGNGAPQGGGAIYADGGQTVITNAVLSGNRALGANAGGGAFRARSGSLTITDSEVSDNVALGGGGGLWMDGTQLSATRLTLRRNRTSTGHGGGLHFAYKPFASSRNRITFVESVVSDNVAALDGGGLWVDGAEATLTHTTVSGNRARRDGGGLHLEDIGETLDVSVVASAFLGNTADRFGGGVFTSGGVLAVQTSTLSGNAALRGGGAATTAADPATDRFDLDASTVAGNAAAGGGGLYNPTVGMRVGLQSAIVADNTISGGPGAGPQLSGYYTSTGHNLIESTAGAGVAGVMASDLVGVDPMLGPLADNGGPTWTHALSAGSPAIDAGDAALATDQRGYARLAPDDIGAFEFGATPPDDATVAPEAVTLARGAVRLGPVAPNPLRTTGRVAFAVAEAVTVELVDIMGRHVRSLYTGTPTDGAPVTVEVDASGLASGVYVVVLSGETVRETRRVIVAR